MASLPSSSCCLTVFKETDAPKGSVSTVGGLPTYVAGENYGDKKVIVILTDVFGFELPNNQVIADKLSELAKVKVLVPDILNGDPVVPTPTFVLQDWFVGHTEEITGPIVKGFLKHVKDAGAVELYGVGHCFGGKYVINNIDESGLLTAGAIAHPSMVTVEEVEKITKPLLISTGDKDASFIPELRDQTVSILTKNEVRFQLDIFQGAPHGYAVKGDVTIPSVKYAKDKTLLDQVHWFNWISALAKN